MNNNKLNPGSLYRIKQRMSIYVFKKYTQYILSVGEIFLLLKVEDRSLSTRVYLLYDVKLYTVIFEKESSCYDGPFDFIEEII